MSEREEVTFQSGRDTCAAWLYRPAAAGGERAPCVVMGHGFSMTRHDGMAPYAERFAAAGAAVLAFDHRHLGDSGGEPRQRFRRGAQLEDWRNAVAFARAQPGVDAARIVPWGFSFGGGHVVELVARDGGFAAALLVCPFLDGLARVLSTSPRDIAWILPRALADMAGKHVTIPVTGQPGEHGALTLPGEADGFAAAIPTGSPWRNEISPGIFATVALIRPVAKARRLKPPVWVCLGEQDVTVSSKAIERLAARAPGAELHRYPVDHFGPFHGSTPDLIAGDQVAFLTRAGVLH
jgi:dienelactone hydrolase